MSFADVKNGWYNKAWVKGGLLESTQLGCCNSSSVQYEPEYQKVEYALAEVKQAEPGRQSNRYHGRVGGQYSGNK